MLSYGFSNVIVRLQRISARISCQPLKMTQARFKYTYVVVDSAVLLHVKDSRMSCGRYTHDINRQEMKH